MSDKMTVRETQLINFPAMMEEAKVLIASGFLPVAIKTPAQAVAIILAGRELGIPTMQALRQINVIQGKPTMAAELMLALAYQRIPNFRYAVIKSTTEECVCQFERPGHKPYQHRFTMADAKSLGLASKDNWRKQPATMLRWRCVSSGLRLVAPDAIAGVYTPEEIIPNAKVNFETGVVDQPEQSPQVLITMPERLPPEKPAVDKVEVELITATDRKHLFATANESGVSDDTLHEHLKGVYKIDSSKLIRKAWFKRVLEWTKAGGQNIEG